MVTDVKKLPFLFDREPVGAFCRDRGIVRLSVSRRQASELRHAGGNRTYANK